MNALLSTQIYRLVFIVYFFSSDNKIKSQNWLINKKKALVLLHLLVLCDQFWFGITPGLILVKIQM